MFLLISSQVAGYLVNLLIASIIDTSPRLLNFLFPVWSAFCPDIYKAGSLTSFKFLLKFHFIWLCYLHTIVNPAFNSSQGCPVYFSFCYHLLPPGIFIHLLIVYHFPRTEGMAQCFVHPVITKTKQYLSLTKNTKEIFEWNVCLGIFPAPRCFLTPIVRALSN